jgi:hypothetical protein
MYEFILTGAQTWFSSTYKMSIVKAPGLKNVKSFVLGTVLPLGNNCYLLLL